MTAAPAVAPGGGGRRVCRRHRVPWEGAGTGSVGGVGVWDRHGGRYRTLCRTQRPWPRRTVPVRSEHPSTASSASGRYAVPPASPSVIAQSARARPTTCSRGTARSPQGVGHPDGADDRLDGGRGVPGVGVHPGEHPAPVQPERREGVRARLPRARSPRRSRPARRRRRTPGRGRTGRRRSRASARRAPAGRAGSAPRPRPAGWRCPSARPARGGRAPGGGRWRRRRRRRCPAPRCAGARRCGCRCRRSARRPPPRAVSGRRRCRRGRGRPRRAVPSARRRRAPPAVCSIASSVTLDADSRRRARGAGSRTAPATSGPRTRSSGSSALSSTVTCAPAATAAAATSRPIQPPPTSASRVPAVSSARSRSESSIVRR